MNSRVHPPPLPVVILCLTGLLLCAPSARAAIGFSKIPAVLPESTSPYGSAQWGDFDRDGDLDVLVTACDTTGGLSGQTFVLRNDGNGSFVRLASPFPATDFSLGSWVDFDNDGDLDIVLAILGYSNPPHMQLFRNNGDGSFSSMSSNLAGTAIAWGDDDNDGDQDALIVGAQWGLEGNSARVYQNMGNGVFVNSGTNIVNVQDGACAWGDFDGDGDLDFVVTGSIFHLTPPPTPDPVTKLYRNDGNGNFVAVDVGLAQTVGRAVAWGDYDHDGDLDLALSDANATVIYRNDSGIFTDTHAGLPGGARFLSWGDDDNDGDLDLLTGNTSGLYRNDGADHFTFVDAGLQADENGDGAWGDYDGDGDLDILARPYPGSCGIFQSSGAPINSPPSAPAGLIATVDGAFTTFSWNASVDDHTPSSGLTYNLRVGTTPGGNEICTAMSGPDGFRRIVQPGNAGERTARRLKLPPGAKYYWSVQAIDGAYAGSAFAPELTLDLTFPTPVESFSAAGLSKAAAAWADFDSDGDLDLVVCGFGGTQSVTHLYRNDSGTFTDDPVGLPGVSEGSVAWADFDRDGDLDLLLTGAMDDGSRIARVYRNDGGTFTDIGAPLTGVSESAAIWWDHDGDGAPDIVLAGESVAGPVARLYDNHGGSFSDSGESLPGVRHALLSVDHADGELLLAGDTGTARITKLYWFDYYLTKHLVEQPQDPAHSVPGVTDGSADWVRVDGDQDEDLALTGETDSGPICRVYLQSIGLDPARTERFYDVDAALPGVSHGSCTWADFDLDGHPDLLVNGLTSSGRITKIYRQASDSVYVDTGLILPGVDEGPALAGDANNDGNLDVLEVGATDGSPMLAVFAVSGFGVNTAPTAPGALSAYLFRKEGQLKIMWGESTDLETSSPDLTYDVRIGTTPGGQELYSAPADTSNGARRLVQEGITFSRYAEFNVADTTTYYCAVQAVDGRHRGSPFAEIMITTPVPALPSVAAVDAANGKIRISWFAAGLEGAPGTAYRRTIDTDWMSLGPAVSDGASLLTYEDATAQVGVRYAYRLGYPKGSIDAFTEPVWAQLPGPDLQFAIDDALPNPIVGRLRVQLSIPEAGPARVELFDTRGRRLATRNVSGLGPGEHLVDVGDGLQLQSGIYFVRATWRDRVARARFVILQ